MGLGIIARVVVEPHFAIAKGAQRLPVGQDDVRHQHERCVEISSGGLAWRAPANSHLAEDLGGAQLAGLVEVLIAHDKDNVVVEGLLDGCAGCVIDLLRQIDPFDLCAKRRMQLRYLHGLFPRTS